ncbi:uncharacterized protein LOC120209714 [Hibiscus syriacus]|uniref:uncharacterized protein LOC120209714 n=1 Tax=Hibiscus syriacus TaxID=106335 RepID=UPI0019231DD3|nr:uncharacterized protein LOC120209714 [Hibiscus syriacus]
MGISLRSVNVRIPNETTRLIIMAFAGVIFGFFLGASFPTVSLTKMNLPSTLFPSMDLTYIEDKYSGLSTQELFNALSTLRANRDTSTYSYNYTKKKVNPLCFDYLCSITIQELRL